SEPFRRFPRADRFDRLFADASARGQDSVARPLDGAVPLTRHQDNRQLFEILRHSTLEAQLRPQRRQIASGLGTVQQGAELQAYLRSVAVPADAIVNFLPLSI